MESSHITPCGRLILRCDEFNFSLVDTSTGEISFIGYDPLGVMKSFKDPMDDHWKNVLAEKIDDDIDQALTLYFSGEGDNNEF